MADRPIVERLVVLIHVDPPPAGGRAIYSVERIDADACDAFERVHRRRTDVGEGSPDDFPGSHVVDGNRRVALEVNLQGRLGGLNDVIQRLSFRRVHSPVFWVRIQRIARSALDVKDPTVEDVRTGPDHMGRHPGVALAGDDAAVLPDDHGIDCAGNRTRDGGKEERVWIVSQISVATVQHERVRVDSLERVVSVRHERLLWAGGAEKVPAVQAVDHPSGRIVGVVRVRVIVQSGEPEVLLKDESAIGVHDDGAVQTKPHDIRVEWIAVREVDVLPQDEGVVEPVGRDRPAFR